MSQKYTKLAAFFENSIIFLYVINMALTCQK